MLFTTTILPLLATAISIPRDFQTRNSAPFMVSVSKEVQTNSGKPAGTTDPLIAHVYLAGATGDIVHVSSLEGFLSGDSQDHHTPSPVHNQAIQQNAMAGPEDHVQLTSDGLVIYGCTDQPVEQLVMIYCAPGADSTCQASYDHVTQSTMLSLPKSCGGGYFAVTDMVTTLPKDSVYYKKLNVTAIKQVLFHYDWERASSALARRDASPVSMMFEMQPTSMIIPAKQRRGGGPKAVEKHLVNDLQNYAFGVGHNFSEVLVNLTTPCALSGLANADLLIELQGTVSYNHTAGAKVTGTIMPPQAHGATSSANTVGVMDVTLAINALAELHFNSGNITLIDMPVLIYGVPGIADVGLHFGIYLNLQAELQMNGNLQVDLKAPLPELAYTIDGNGLTHNGTQIATPTGTPSIDISGAIALNASVQATVGAKLYVGVKILGGLAAAEAGIKAYAYAGADLYLNANGTAGTTTKEKLKTVGGDATASADVFIGAGVDFYAEGSAIWGLASASVEYNIGGQARASIFANSNLPVAQKLLSANGSMDFSTNTAGPTRDIPFFSNLLSSVDICPFSFSL